MGLDGCYCPPLHPLIAHSSEEDQNEAILAAIES